MEEKSGLPLWSKIILVVLFGGVLIVLTYITDGEVIHCLDFDFDFFHKKKKDEPEEDNRDFEDIYREYSDSNGYGAVNGTSGMTDNTKGDWLGHID